jgi:DNA-binding MarR family transcriptional regulator
MSLTQRDYEALATFRLHLREFLHFSEQQARAHQIEPQQHQALLALKGLPKGCQPTIRELSRRLLLQHHSTVELVNRLENAGLIQRTPDPEDGRQILLRLTAQGSAKLKALSVTHRDEIRVKGPELARALRKLLKETNTHDQHEAPKSIAST